MVRKDAGDISIALAGGILSSDAIPSVNSPIQCNDGRSLASNQAPLKPKGPKSGIAGASFNLLNATIGAGVVALPFAIKECGFIMGTILLIVLALVMDRYV